MVDISQLSVPANRSLVQIDVHLLSFEILFNAPRSEFASESGLLVAAPRRFHVSRLHMVHPYDARAQRLHGPHSFENITRPNRSGQPVGSVIRDLQRVFFVLKRNYSRHRSKDLFARDAGAVIDVIEDSRLHIVALGELIGASATGGYLRLFPTNFKVRAHAIVLLLRYQGSHFSIALERRTDLDLLRLLGHGFNKLFVNRFLDEHPAARRAHFSLIDKDSEQGPVDSRFEIG